MLIEVKDNSNQMLKEKLIESKYSAMRIDAYKLGITTLPKIDYEKKNVRWRQKVEGEPNQVKTLLGGMNTPLGFLNR